MLGAAMDVETLTGTIIGFVTAIALLTHQLIRYEDYLNDRKLYIGSGLGFISAFVAYIFEQLGIFSFYVSGSPEDYSRAFVSIFGIAILHTALKGYSLNRASLREGKDPNIAFYGAAFGYIFGAVYVTILVSKSLKSGDASTPIEFILLLLLSIGVILFQGSTGVIMGWGVSRGEMLKFFAYVTGAHIFLNSVIFLRAVFLIPSPLMVAFVLAYGVFLYAYTYRVVLPASLTKEQRKKLFGEKRGPTRRLSESSKSRNNAR